MSPEGSFKVKDISSFLIVYLQIYLAVCYQVFSNFIDSLILKFVVFFQEQNMAIRSNGKD